MLFRILLYIFLVIIILLIVNHYIFLNWFDFGVLGLLSISTWFFVKFKYYSFKIVLILLIILIVPYLLIEVRTRIVDVQVKKFVVKETKCIWPSRQIKVVSYNPLNKKIGILVIEKEKNNSLYTERVTHFVLKINNQDKIKILSKNVIYYRVKVEGKIMFPIYYILD